MSLATPKEKQVKFARQVAWERGKRLERVPATSSALSGLIQHLIDTFEPLPATEDQLDRIAKLEARAAELLDDFTPSEGVTDRATANKVLYSLRVRLSRVEYRGAMSNASDFISDGEAAPVADSGDVPF